MEYKPYPHQRKAIDFIKSHDSVALLLDMGLGKTGITLTSFMELREAGVVDRLMVVAPKRVAEITWPAEVETWDHLKGLRVSIIRGDAKKRREACLADADIYVIGRDSVAWLDKEGICPKCDMLAVDEMQSFKSATSARTTAMINLRPRFKRCVGLSGTPAPNGWLDLWAQYRIVDQGEALGKSFWAFRQNNFNPGKTIVRQGRQCILNYVPKIGREVEFERLIAPITLSMKAIDNLNLPPIRFTRLYCEMDEKEKADYDNFAKSLEGYVGGEKFKVPSDETLVAKLVQLASGTAYQKDGRAVPIHSHKVETLLEMIEESEGRPLLVAYWFRHDAERIRDRFRVREIRTGKDIDDWNRGDIPVAIIHPASAGHGLNLQEGGSTLIWFGLTWSLELYQQTNARLHRQGQRNTVIIHHIICRGTVDERVMEALRRKEGIQDALMEAVKAEVYG